MTRMALLFFTTLILFACQQEDLKPPFDNTRFYEDHQSANWTKETAKEHLQGKWKLIYTYCCPMSPNSGWVAVDDDYFEIQIESDSIKVYTNQNLEQTQYWKFDERYEDAFYLETAEYIPNTSGTIYFSEDNMLFHSSPVDGPDNYYQRIY